MDDMDCFADTMACLHVLGPVVTVAGLIFVTAGNQERLTAQELQTIQWIKCFCGPEFYRYITILTSKWDKINEDSFEESWESMLDMLRNNPSVFEILNPPATPRDNWKKYQGGHVYHHGIVAHKDHPNVALQCLKPDQHVKERADMAVAMIKSRYKKAPSVKLQIIHEMGNNIPWYKTEAAKILEHNPKDVELDCQNGILQVVVKRKGYGLHDESELLQPATNHWKPTGHQRPTGAKGNTQLARDDTPKAAEEQTWIGKIWTWLKIARDVALVFMRLM